MGAAARRLQAMPVAAGSRAAAHTASVPSPIVVDVLPASRQPRSSPVKAAGAAPAPPVKHIEAEEVPAQLYSACCCRVTPTNDGYCISMRPRSVPDRQSAPH